MAVLPDSPWKQFLNRRIENIHHHSILQDENHKGPDHYINLENTEVLGPREVSQTDRTFEGVQRHFTPELQSQLADRFEKQPLDVATLTAARSATSKPPGENWDGQSNVYDRIQRSYDHLVAELKEATAKPPGWIFEKVRRMKALEKTVGELSHYVADLHQPMHTTGFHSWPTAYVWRSEYGYDINGSHDVFERALFSTEELWRWRKGIEKEHGAVPLPKSKEAIMARLGREVEKGYLLMPDLIDTDGKAWDTTGNDEDYFEVLRKAWRPIAQHQMEKGTENLSAMLALAYKEAGKPDLSVLNVSPTALRLVTWFTILPKRILAILAKPFQAIGLINIHPQQETVARRLEPDA